MRPAAMTVHATELRGPTHGARVGPLIREDASGPYSPMSSEMKLPSIKVSTPVSSFSVPTFTAGLP